MGLKQGQDPNILREKAYADDAHLDVRQQTHRLYTVNPVDFGRWTLEQLAWRGNERVLDVGCGPGELLNGMARRQEGWGALIGFDFSHGMIRKAIDSNDDLATCFFVGDAQAIPFPDATFDVVMARHMLYHVPDVNQALAEAARVLCHGGSFLATTNSAHTMPEYTELRNRAAEHFPSLTEPGMVTTRFSLESAADLLEPYFDQVQTIPLPGTLRFPSAQPFVDYFASARAMTMNPDHSEAEWQAILEFVKAETEAVIARQGHFDVTKIAGAALGIKGARL